VYDVDFFIFVVSKKFLHFFEKFYGKRKKLSHKSV